MSWIMFSIFSAAIFAVVNIIDKYILSKLVKEPVVPLMISGIIGFFVGILYLSYRFTALSFQNILLVFVAAIFYVLTILFYFKAVKLEEISKIVALFYLRPLFVSILAAISLGEIFTLLKYMGIFFLVIGAAVISSKGFMKLSFGKAFWFMIIASLTSSFGDVITKYLLNFADFWAIFSYTRIGMFFALFPFLCFRFPSLLSSIKKRGKKLFTTISLNESLTLLADLLLTVAMASGYVTLVIALSSLQPFFVLLFALILSIFSPQILKEEISGSAVLLKLVGIALIFIGAVLIT